MVMFEVSRLVALPEGFPLGVCEAVLGPFPRGNPEALRAGGDAWERAARRCRSEAEKLAGVASSVPECLSGDTAVEAQRVLYGSADRKRDLAVFCESKAVECRETANAIELGQFTWIVMGSALVVELLASLAMPVGGMAAAAGARAAARKGWQLAWAQLIESVIALCARLSASRAALVGQGIVVGGVFAGGVTWGGQVWQQHRGDRDTIDWETVTVSGAGGAAGGMGAGVLYTRPVAGALARLQAAGTRGANAVAMLLAGGAAGVAGGATGTLGGAVAASAYSGDLAMPDGSEFYLGAVSGALEGLLSGGVHTLGHSATPPPPPAGLFDRPARSPKPSDLAAIFARDMNARASGPSGRADLPGITAAGSAHPSSRPGDRPPAAPVSSVKPGANSIVGAAGTATDPDPDPAAASTEHLPPSDRSASNPSPDLTTPGVPAVADATAYTGTDSHPSAAVDSYVNRYGGGDRYGVRATVDPAGVVRAEIRTGDNTPQGVDMFSDVLRNLGHLATEFRVEWIAADAIADDLPGHHGDGTPTPLVTREGAVDPAISRLAAQHGFTRIDGWGESAGQPGERRSTAVRFLRPEEPEAVDAEPVAGPERTMVLPDDSNARRPGDAPAGPANPAGERDDGDPVSGQAPPRVRGMRDIDGPPLARREGEAGDPIPRESPAADERGWRQRRVQDESELARVLYHRPETRQAVIAVIDRLRVVLSGLHPQATREQIDNAFYTPEETISGGMVLRSVPLDELRRDGNLRELMAAVQNAMWRNRDIPHPSGTTLDDGLARLLNRPDWAEQAERLGLKVDALARVRASITGGDSGAVIAAQELRFVRHAMSDPGQHAISEEIIHSGAIRGPRDTPEQRRRSLTVQDWSLLGMPLSIRELEAIPGGLVALRKTRLDPHRLLPRDNRGRVDVTALETQLAAEDRAFRHALPLYRYDERGRRVRDESGHAVVDGILVYHEEGTVDAATALRLDPHRFAVPLPWSPGAVRFEFDKDGEWFRRTAVERGVPAGSGVSGTAARIASRFNWIMPHSVPKQDFAGAILALLLPLHHSLYETVRGMQMVGTSVVDPAVFRASDSMVADLYRAVFDRFGISAPDESSGKQITELIGISGATGSPSANTPDATTEPVPPDPGEPGWRLLRLRDEVELARVLYHRPESRQAAVAMLDRLREVLTALHPGAAPAEIDNAFYAPENTKAGGMVPRSVSLDELRREGNLRELMAAVYNAMLRSGELAGNPSTTTLDDGVAALLNEKNWAEKAQRLGLDVDALGQVRTWVTGDDPRQTIGKNDIRDVRNTVRYPGDRDIADERTLSSADERERDPREQIRRGLTVQDWALLGMPLSPRELAAIPGELVALRKSRLDPGRVLPRDGRGRVDADALESELAAEDETFRFAVPLYEYDDIGRRMRDEAGDAVVSGVLVYREVGPVDADTALRLDPGEFAVPLPWGAGVSAVAFAKDGEWFRKVAVEQRVPLLAGLSGTAARLAARFLWMRPPGVSEIDAAGVILALLSPQHHSLYEQVRGMQMSGLRLVDDAVLRSPGGSVGELYRAVFELFGVPAPEGSARVAPLAAGSTGGKPADHTRPLRPAGKCADPVEKVIDSRRNDAARPPDP
jgi:hypothetical protein